MKLIESWQVLCVPSLIDGEDIASNEQTDDLSVMLYVSYLKQADLEKIKQDNISAETNRKNSVGEELSQVGSQERDSKGQSEVSEDKEKRKKHDKEETEEQRDTGKEEEKTVQEQKETKNVQNEQPESQICHHEEVSDVERPYTEIDKPKEENKEREATVKKEEHKLEGHTPIAADQAVPVQILPLVHDDQRGKERKKKKQKEEKDKTKKKKKKKEGKKEEQRGGEEGGKTQGKGKKKKKKRREDTGKESKKARQRDVKTEDGAKENERTKKEIKNEPEEPSKGHYGKEDSHAAGEQGKTEEIIRREEKGAQQEKGLFMAETNEICQNENPTTGPSKEEDRKEETSAQGVSSPNGQSSISEQERRDKSTQDSLQADANAVAEHLPTAKQDVPPTEKGPHQEDANKNDKKQEEAIQSVTTATASTISNSAISSQPTASRIPGASLPKAKINLGIFFFISTPPTPCMIMVWLYCPLVLCAVSTTTI